MGCRKRDWDSGSWGVKESERKRKKEWDKDREKESEKKEDREITWGQSDLMKIFS